MSILTAGRKLAAPDWDPRSGSVLDDQIAAYDAMRRQCPVARSDYLHWSIFRHADVMRALLEPETFSNVVSTHLSVPNGMDPPQHTDYRRVIEPYFSAERMAAFEPACKAITRDLIARLPLHREVEVIACFAQEFALRVQSAFLDWPAELQEPLRNWTRKNREATLSGDKAATAAVAREFDAHIRGLLAARRQRQDEASQDVATRLLAEQVQGRVLTDEELVSILRNWTVGELATISASIGILVHYLATHPSLQQFLRDQPSNLAAAIDEILRIHAPLIASRRRTTRSVEFGDRCIAGGERLTLMWASANRDEAVFGDPDEFRLDRDPAHNLLYGAGIHVCPGAPLARLELRVVMEELLRATRGIALSPGTAPTRAVYPGSGFYALPILIT